MKNSNQSDNYIKSSKTRDEWWYYSIAQWENPYFGIEQNE